MEVQKTKLDPDNIDVAVIKQRILGIMALETARWPSKKKVLTDVREARCRLDPRLLFDALPGARCPIST